MKAMVYHRYGGPEVLELADLRDPVPAANDVLIRVRATSVTAADWRARSLKVPPGFEVFARPAFGFFGPRNKILGTEISGDVVAVGPAVTKFKVGNAVFAQTGAKYGGYAELMVLPETGAIAPKPSNVTYEEAAGLCFGGQTAMHFFRRAGLKRGDRVLVNGASSGVGVAAVQLAKHAGAIVTAVTSGRNAELVTSLGADRVIDYTRGDFRHSGETWDVVMDTIGTVTVDNACPVVEKGGSLLLVAGTLGDMFSGGKARRRGFNLIAGPAPESRDDIQQLAELAAAGAYRTVIDRVYPLEQAGEAHAYVETDRKRGSVILTVGAQRALGAAA